MEEGDGTEVTDRECGGSVDSRGEEGAGPGGLDGWVGEER